MGDKFYAADIPLMMDILQSTTEEIESTARRLVTIGTNIHSFTGKTAESVEERYAVHYRALLEEQSSCGQDALSAVRMCLNAFQEIDHGNAVIYGSRLEENSAYLKGVLGDAAGVFASYNQILHSISHTGADLIGLTTDRIDNMGNDEMSFSDQLKDRLKAADFAATAALKKASEQYALLIMHQLDMFDAEVQVKLLNMMDGKISQGSLKYIKENLEIENERRRLLLYLETEKEAIMAELGIETDEAYAEYVKGVLLTLELWQEYRDEIEVFQKMSLDERLVKYPFGGTTPLSEFIFLVQLIEVDDIEKRKELLKVCQLKGGKITNEDIDKILGLDTDSFLDLRDTILSTMYKNSLAGHSMPEFMQMVNEYDRQRLNQVVMFGMTPYLMEYQFKRANPLNSNVSLDPNVRLDRIELDSQKGFGTFEYVPLTWDSIKRSGEIMPSPGDSNFIGPIQVPGKGTSGAGKGKLTGSFDKLTQAERDMVEDLLKQGKDVEIIPRSNIPEVKTPDFKVNGVPTELKTLNGESLNTPVTRIQKGFKQGAQTVIIDGRGSGLTAEQAKEVLERINGIYKDGIPGKIEIWTNEGIIRGGK